MAFEYLNHSLRCQEIQNKTSSVHGDFGIKPTIEMYEAIIIILVTGFLAILVAWLFHAIRKYIYKDQDHVDTSFDAGGKVNAGLTASTIVCQWTWAATFLQSTTVTVRYGISGSFWYAAGATIQMLLFSMLAVQIKTRAPGAKTFLQVIRARFGKRSHIVFCCYALVTNILVTSMLMLGGSAVINALVKLISVEYAITLMAIIIGSYTFVGGLGATFYVSYFSIAIIYVIIFVFVYTVFEDSGDNPSNAVGHVSNVFDYVSCVKGPNGNKGWSYLTIVSDQGLKFGLSNVVGNFGTLFVDQSYWQSAIAAKPRQGVIGFLLGGLAWFAIPFSLSTALGLAYIALSAEQGHELLKEDDVNAGLVAPFVAYRLLGKSGHLMIVSIMLITVTSTASAEVMAVTSIVVYDIYALYLKPYRVTNDTNSCILCGRARGRMANPVDKCNCISMTHCVKCHRDTISRAECRRAIKPDYTCPIHRNYRIYDNYLGHLKNWAVIWTTIAVIPFTVILYMIQVNLSWVYLFSGILIGSAVAPITLTMFWERLTSEGMIAGTIGGTVFAVSVWLGVASTYEGGLSKWWTNTGQVVAMMSGNLSAILGGGVITVVVSLLTNLQYDVSKGEEIWENTRDIDNPLSPWMEKYQKELNIADTQRLVSRPSLQDVQAAFKGAHTLAYSVSTVISITLLVIWPAIMVAVDIMSQQQFQGWVILSEIWVVLSMVVMTVLPLFNEIWDIWKQFKVKLSSRYCSSLSSQVLKLDQIKHTGEQRGYSVGLHGQRNRRRGGETCTRKMGLFLTITSVGLYGQPILYIWVAYHSDNVKVTRHCVDLMTVVVNYDGQELCVSNSNNQVQENYHNLTAEVL